jgi:PIN domain nuclease of toxin-antitoxin system
VADRAEANGLELLPLSPSAALAAALLDWVHRAPVERILAEVAGQDDLFFISVEAAFAFLGVARRWG